MGKFNLNQILNNASRQAAEGGDNPPRPAESEIKKISVFDLVPSEDNFYSMREIEELKAAIEIAGKVLQNLTVVPLDGGKYKVIAGHRRRLASLALVEDGKPQYEFVTCSVEPNEEAAEDQEIRDGLNLIVTNSQREKTAWDKIEEVRYLRDVLERQRPARGSWPSCKGLSKPCSGTARFRRTEPAILSQKCFIPARRRLGGMTPLFATCPRSSKKN